jgi:hypothetical protein
MHPNVLALIALGGYPLVVLVLFLLYRPPAAAALSLVIAEMVLPSVVALPLHPNWLDKVAISTIATFVCALFFARSYRKGSRPFRGIEFIFLIWLVGCFFTTWTNRDAVQYGPVTLSGETFADFVSEALHMLCVPWACFFLGRTLYRTSRDLMSLHRIMAVAITIFTLPILFEIRMSPQISNMFYGFNPTLWGMVYRWGGYRPLVTFNTGIHLASFLLFFAIMTTAMARVKARMARIPMPALCAYLLAVLVLCKSTGAIVYAAVMVPLVVFSSPRRMLRVATTVTIIFVVYPILRFYELIPTDSIVDLFAKISQDRADSLKYRFDMEKGMLDWMARRPWFGWGGYSRGFVHDLNTGANLSIPDGSVIINLSVHGGVGFFTYFLPYVYAILRAPRFVKRIKSRTDRILISALCLNGAVVLLDLAFNSSFFPIYMFLLGAVYGLGPGILAEEARAELLEAHASQAEHPPAPSYALPR